MKKIIIIGYPFYGYEKEIQEEVKKKYEVYFVDISLNFFERNISRIKRTYKNINYEIIRDRFVEQKIKKLEALNKGIEYDFVLVLGYYKLPIEYFNYIKTKMKVKKIFLYIWDTINVIPNFDQYRKNFDKIFSFDRSESTFYNLIYRPTFYSNRLKKYKNIKHKYKISFIGEFTEERYKLIEKYFINTKDSYFFIFTYPRLYLKKILEDKKYFKILFPFYLKREKFNKILTESNIILDLVRFNQEGLNQRVLDCLYLNKKIITTNNKICDYEFYNKNNILVLDENTQLEEIEKFKESKYVEILPQIIEYYSLTRWIKDIFEGE